MLLSTTMFTSKQEVQFFFKKHGVHCEFTCRLTSNINHNTGYSATSKQGQQWLWCNIDTGHIKVFKKDLCDAFMF